MKRIIVTVLTVFALILGAKAQPQGFTYQAAISGADGEPLSNQAVTVRVNILEGSATGDIIYTEEHQATTNAQGVVTLAVGYGEATKGSFAEMTWGRSTRFIGVEVQIDGQGAFIPAGTSQILSVPYALYSGNGLDNAAGSAGQTLAHTGERWAANDRITAGTGGVTINPDEGHDPSKPIFAVRNSLGDTIFAVYENGVKILIDDTPGKANKGGFAIGGLSSMKNGEGNEYLKVTPDSTVVQFVTDDERANKGGFAVGGLSNMGKPTSQQYLTLTPAEARISFDMDAAGRANKGGFAIGGLSNGKSEPQDYFTLNADSIRVYIDTDETKANKGGFAVGGLSNMGKPTGMTFLSLMPSQVRFNFLDDPNLKANKGGFAIGGLSNGKTQPRNYFTLQNDSVVFALNEDEAKGIKGTFAVGTINDENPGQVAKVFTVDRDSTYIGNTMYSAGDMYVGGNLNAGGGVNTVVTDVNGNNYPVLTLGEQQWMGRNLKATSYNDGTPITGDIGQYYVENPAIATDVAGLLYLNEAMTSGKNICPSGWRLPNTNDWMTLANYAATQYPGDATALLGNYGWQGLESTTNASQFDAVPAGNAVWNKAMGILETGAVAFGETNVKGQLWVKDENILKVFNLPEGQVENNGSDAASSYGYSIRCVK